MHGGERFELHGGDPGFYACKGGFELFVHFRHAVAELPKAVIQATWLMERSSDLRDVGSVLVA
jgi:hypothetical protein